MLRLAASRAAFVFFAMLFAASAFAQDATLSRARALIDAKQAQAAFDLLDPLEASRAGDPDFDYLLGIAAIDSGQYTRAVFALERVLAVQPDNAQARAEIARAYFLMGENRAAREEFEAVKSSKPPPAVTATVDQFLNALQAREAVRENTGISGYFELGYGHDSNANAATATGSFAIPAISGVQFTLNQNGQKTPAYFYSLGGGLSGRYRISSEWALLGSATAYERYDISESQFNIGTLTGDGGVSWRRDKQEVVGLLQFQEYDVGFNAFRRANGGTLQWRYNLTPDSQMTLYGQHARLVYPGQRERDTVRDVLGGAWAKSFAGSLTPTIYVGAYSGHEQETHGDFGFYGSTVNGIRAGGQVTLTPKMIAFVSTSYEDRKYHAPDPLFLDTRHDQQTDYRVGMNYVVGRNWTLTPSVAYTDNRSNIVIDQYSRWVISVTARVDFR